MLFGRESITLLLFIESRKIFLKSRKNTLMASFGPVKRTAASTMAIRARIRILGLAS
jgi:hypothetical protein